MVQAPAKVRKKAMRLLTKDERFFLAEYDDIKKLLDTAHTIVQTIHNLAERRKNLVLLKRMHSELDRLEKYERWQQWTSMYPKLKEAMINLLRLPIFTPEQRERLKADLEKEHVFENRLLHDTVEGLEPEISKKTLHRIDWPKVQKLIFELKEDLEALIAIIRDMKKIIKLG